MSEPIVMAEQVRQIVRADWNTFTYEKVAGEFNALLAPIVQERERLARLDEHDHSCCYASCSERNPCTRRRELDAAAPGKETGK